MPPQYYNSVDDNSGFATEIDQLLPVNERKTYSVVNNSSRHERCRRIIVASIASFIIVAFCSILYSEFNNHPPKSSNKQDRSYDPRKQILVLDDMTSSKINTELSKYRMKNWKALQHTQKHKSSTTATAQDTTLNVCTSQLMIMRHCEKGSEVKGQNRHCSVKGKKRSEYIATLFNEDLTQEAEARPSFPVPTHLYALSKERYKHKYLDHNNLREIETLTPTAKKFGLTIDKRYGVFDEGDLALNFFDTLSKNVAKNLWTLTTMDEAEAPATNKSGTVCNNDLVVVNWKHSRIPKLAQALACGEKEGCPDKYHKNDFDTVWMLTFEYTVVVEGGDNNDALSESNSHRDLRKPLSSVIIEEDWKVSAELVKENFTD